MLPYENNEPNLVHLYQSECHNPDIQAECHNPDIQGEASDLVYRRKKDAVGLNVPQESW